MSRTFAAMGDVETLDRLAAQDSPIHRLDPRAKVVATAMFVVTVVSFPKHATVEMMPLLLYPTILLAAGHVPIGVVVRYLLMASPFAVLVGLFNPILDREIVVRWGPLAMSGGWMSFLSIMIRFLLTVSAALALLACTGYVPICAALGRLGAPSVMVTQFLLLYRFIFIVADEASRMARAHELRSRSGRGAVIRVWGSLAGHLFLRAYDRGLRVHAAMLVRGFAGTMRPLRVFRWSLVDSCFVIGCGVFLVLVRFGNVAERIGRLTLEAVG